MNSEILYLKTITNELLKKAVIIQWNVWKNWFVKIYNQFNRKNSRSSNAKENCNSYLEKKNKKLVKRSKITTHQLKAIENPNMLTLL